MRPRRITYSKYPFELIAKLNRSNPTSISNENPRSRMGDKVSNTEVMHICSVVCNQPNLISSLHESVQSTCILPWKMHIVDNGSSERNLDASKSICADSKIGFYSRTSEYGLSRSSQAHGDALDYIVKTIGSENSLILIVDSDMFFVKKGWDEMLRSRLPISGHITTVRSETIISPAAFISLFRKRTIKNKRISFMPEVNKTGKAVLGKDVGSQLARIPKSRWVNLENVQAGGKQGITSIAGSYDISMDGVPIVSHLSRGRMSGRRKDFMEAWLDQCREYAKTHN